MNDVVQVEEFPIQLKVNGQVRGLFKSVKEAQNLLSPGEGFWGAEIKLFDTKNSITHQLQHEVWYKLAK